jgi:hypothetical protein
MINLACVPTARLGFAGVVSIDTRTALLLDPPVFIPPLPPVAPPVDPPPPPQPARQSSATMNVLDRKPDALVAFVKVPFQIT